MCFHVPPESGRSLFSNGLAVTESLGSTVITTYIPYTSDVLSIWHVYIVPYYSRERILQGVHIYIYRDIIYLYYSQFTSAQKGAMQITIC